MGGIALAVVIPLLFAASLKAKTVYVSSTGNDANEGSRGRPVLTLYQAGTTV